MASLKLQSRAFVRASFRTPRHGEKSDGIIHAEDSSHRRDRSFNFKGPCFAVKLETRLWYIQRYICHRCTTATCSQHEKHHKRKQHKDTHSDTTRSVPCPGGRSLPSWGRTPVTYSCLAVPLWPSHLLSARGSGLTSLHPRAHSCHCLLPFPLCT